MLSLKTWIFLAGIFQIILSLGSLAIPGLLNWKREVAKLSPLIRQIFWVYACYILTTNLSFGLLSSLAPQTLMDGSTLATAVSCFILLHWAARVCIQFFYFDRKSAPKGWVYFWGEIGLVTLFFFFTAVYTYTVYFNFSIVGK